MADHHTWTRPEKRHLRSTIHRALCECGWKSEQWHEDLLDARHEAARHRAQIEADLLREAELAKGAS